MNRRDLTVLTAVGLGALTLYLAKLLRDRMAEPTADQLAADLRKQLDSLEQRFSALTS